MGDITVRGSAPTPLPAQSEQTVKSSAVKTQTQQGTQQKSTETSSKKPEVNKQHAAHKKSEQNIAGTSKQTELTQKLKAVKVETNKSDAVDATKPVSREVNTAPLPKQARVIALGLKTQFDFGRPLTQDEAARTIFSDGKVPNEAKLVQGPGNNNWTLQTSDTHAQQTTMHKMRGRTETKDYSNRNEHLITWNESPTKAPTGPRRTDLQNDFGFQVSNTYNLDQGQHPTGKLGLTGRGYEVVFDRAMTKNQVMEKLFDKNVITEGHVKLVPIGIEPTPLWKVETIGYDAMTAFKQPGYQAFIDADAHTKTSLPSGTPDGIRNHFKNHTIAQDATHHPPTKYVWEQDGHMIYVKKGPDGRNEDFQVTKMPTDEQGAIWMRHYMKKEGMQPSAAWHSFWRDTLEVSVMQLGMITGVERAPRMPRAMPRPSANTSPRSSGSGSSRSNITSPPPKQPNVASDVPSTPKKPTTDIGKASTAEQQAGKSGMNDSAKTKNVAAQERSKMSEAQAITRQQEKVVEDAIGQLDEGELISIRDWLHQNGALHPGKDDRILRDQRGMKIPGDRKAILRETRKAIEKSTDPELVDLLEKRKVRLGQRETTITDELRKLREARVRERVENPGARIPQEQGYPRK